MGRQTSPVKRSRESLYQPRTLGAVANRLRRRISDQTVLGSNPAVADALSLWTRLFTPIVPRKSLHISFYLLSGHPCKIYTGKKNHCILHTQCILHTAVTTCCCVYTADLTDSVGFAHDTSRSGSAAAGNQCLANPSFSYCSLFNISSFQRNAHNFAVSGKLHTVQLTNLFQVLVFYSLLILLSPCNSLPYRTQQNKKMKQKLCFRAEKLEKKKIKLKNKQWSARASIKNANKLTMLYRLRQIQIPIYNVDGELAELIKRSASDQLSDLVPTVRSRIFPGFWTLKFVLILFWSWFSHWFSQGEKHRVLLISETLSFMDVHVSLFRSFRKIGILPWDHRLP